MSDERDRSVATEPYREGGVDVYVDDEAGLIFSAVGRVLAVRVHVAHEYSWHVDGVTIMSPDKSFVHVAARLREEITRQSTFACRAILPRAKSLTDQEALGTYAGLLGGWR